MHRSFVPMAIASAVVLGSAAYFAKSGNLNPPAGAVSPTGHTVTEIYDAIGALSAGSGGTPLPTAEIRDVIAVTIRGASQGFFPGDDNVFGQANSIQVTSYAANVVVPVDQGGGSTNGQRVYGPIVFRKQIDKTTPLFHRSVAINEPIVRATFQFFRTDSSGAPASYYTVEIEDARIVGIQTMTTEIGPSMLVHEEEISITFREITWTHVTGGTTATDMIDSGP